MTVTSFADLAMIKINYCYRCSQVKVTSFHLFLSSLAHYVEAATEKMGFQGPGLSSKQLELPRTRLAINLVSLTVY